MASRVFGNALRAGDTTILSQAIKNYLRVNLDSVTYFDPEQKFLNLFNGGGGNNEGGIGGWTTWASGYPNGGDTLEEPWLQTDANGYVTSMVAGNGFSGTQAFTAVQCYMNFNMPYPITGITNIYPTGPYTFQWEGPGTFYFGSDVEQSSMATSTPGVTVNTSTGVITSTLAMGVQGQVTFNIPSAQYGITFRQSDPTSVLSPTNYPTNFALVQSSLLGQYNAGGINAIYHPNFINMMKNVGYGGIRFMTMLQGTGGATPVTFTAALSAGATTATIQIPSGGWNRPNGIYQVLLGSTGPNESSADKGQIVYARLTYQSTACTFVTSGSTYTSYTAQGITNAVTYNGEYAYMMLVPYYTSWAARPQQSNLFWSTLVGVPYEVCLALATVLNVDAWIGIPWWATTFFGQQAFWTSLATLIQSLINSTQKVYIELSNEYWNSAQAISQSWGVCGTAMFPSIGNFTEAGAQFYGSQVAQVGDAVCAEVGETQFNAQFSVGMGGQMSSPTAGGGAYLFNMAMTAPAWVALGNEAPYKHHVNAAHWAPYWLGNENPSAAASVTFNAPFSANAGAGSLTAGISSPTGSYPYVQTITFSDGEVRNVTLTAANQTALTWSPVLTGTPSTAAQTGDIAAILASGVQATQLDVLFGLAYTNVYGGITYSSIPSGGWVGQYVTNMAYTVNAAITTQPWAGLPVHSYEGGQGFNGGASNWITLYEAANRDQRMALCYYDPTNEFSENPGFLVSILEDGGLETFTYFSSCGSYSQYGAYAACENIMQSVGAQSTWPYKLQSNAEYIAAP
jgi:hypothetical protein